MKQTTMTLRTAVQPRNKIVNMISHTKTLFTLPALLIAAFISAAPAATVALDWVARSMQQQDVEVLFLGNTEINNGISEVAPASIPYLQSNVAGDFNQDYFLSATVPFSHIHSLSSQHSTVTTGPDSLHMVFNMQVTNSCFQTNDGPAIGDADGNYVRNGHYGTGYFYTGTAMEAQFTIDEPHTVTLSVASSGIAPTNETGGVEFSLLNSANVGSVSNGLDIGYGGGLGSGYINFPFSHALPGAAGTEGTITLFLDAGTYQMSAIAADGNSTVSPFSQGNLPVGNASYAATRFINFTLDVQPAIKLDIQSLTNAVQVSWNATPTNWVLEFTPNLATTSWTNDLTVPIVQNGTNSILKAVNDAARYWRLRYQP